MNDAVDKILLLPRYTSFAGAGTFLTAPMNVRAYGQAIVTFYETAALGTSWPAVAVYIDDSPDLEIWNEPDAGLGINTPTTVEFRMEWIRMRVVVGSGDPGVTCWCVGDFVRRHG